MGSRANHGTRSRYQLGCRCSHCRRAQTRYSRDYKRLQRATRARVHGTELVDATPSMWRLRSLTWMGHTQRSLAAALGISELAVNEIVNNRRTRIGRERADTIATLFDTLCLIDGGSSHARTVANRNGWPPPLSLTEDGYPTSPCQRGHYQGAAGECRECRRWRERENARKQRERGVSP